MCFCNVFVAVDAVATVVDVVVVLVAAAAATAAADINRRIEFQSGLPGCINSAAVDS